MYLNHKKQSFSCYWKNVRLKRYAPRSVLEKERGFSCYWKNVRLKLTTEDCKLKSSKFQLLLKECTIEANSSGVGGSTLRFQLLLKECTIEAADGSSFEAVSVCFSCYWKNVRLKLRNQLIENKRFLTVGFWSVFRKWSICTKSAIIFENLGWLLDCFW